jgi:putative colanic acid biosysnthesis UDP-glucose lipid carrier transferase
MMKQRIGRYSIYIRPLSYVIDWLIINLFSFFILPESLNTLFFHVFITISWFMISWNGGFYDVYRYTKISDIFSKVLRQYFLFLVVNFAFVGYFLNISESHKINLYIGASIILITFFKISIYLTLRKFRAVYGGNFRKVVIAGYGKDVEQLADFFSNNVDYGYKLEHVFSFRKYRAQQMQDFLAFVQSQKIDEIYASLSVLSSQEINELIDFADNNLKVIKFLPDNKSLLSRNLHLEYYGFIPILSLRKIALDEVHNKIIKRVFDIVFSLVVIIGVLSWLTPLLAILIKWETKGPIFFKQKRNGLNYEEFYCFKFRSMQLNEIADLEQVSKNDPRITRVGKIIRKTSMDELPQFFNVLKGEMSVCGPRPHMVSHTEMYAKRINKFMVRHFIKPGITGMAQTHGFRGEVENERDIINRVKYDIFYVENWSILLDLKIIYLTVFNAVKGEEKAY